MSSQVLAYPDFSVPFILDVDASKLGVGAVLSQKIDVKERVIAYYTTERNYCTTGKELLPLVSACEHFKHFLLENSLQ